MKENVTTKFVYYTKNDAEKLLDMFRKMINECGNISVYDTYALLDSPCSEDNDDFGWNDLSEAYISRDLDGYLINLPKTMLLNSNHDECGFSVTGKYKQKGKWLFWPGWVGCCDKRIENAKCSTCGYKHPTVYGSLDKLSKYCPGCGREMSVPHEVD